MADALEQARHAAETARSAMDARAAQIEKDSARWLRRLLVANLIIWVALAVMAGVYYFPQLRSAEPLHCPTERIDE